MKTEHVIHFCDARKMKGVYDGSVDLVVTSPPYPMIEMWDNIFSRIDPPIGIALKKNKGAQAFELMHKLLDRVWKELGRVVRTGGFACINIGDAVRKIGDDFCLYPNHSRIMSAMRENGFMSLPAIIWRKQTNAPNKFMGSGMLPAGAYVTLEHEYVLIFRKGGKREFMTPSKRAERQASAFFWEERNQWFSDVWFDLKGARQALLDKDMRKRSGAYPFELAYRLINMYSVKGDCVLDPFAGTGTTMLAAMVSARNSVSCEIGPEFAKIIDSRVPGVMELADTCICERIKRHRDFIAERVAAKKPIKYVNGPHGFPVVTRQEVNLSINPVRRVEKIDKNRYAVEYGVVEKSEADAAPPVPHSDDKASKKGGLAKKGAAIPGSQLTLFGA
ncbi:MAG: site-specific DNA-methyltransferase [Deltaproteobacteria bacterium]|nr:site-specific DNA-methyltransferase [Deltaproteobacteria bacterium]